MRLAWEGRREPAVEPLALPAGEPLLVHGDNLAALAGLTGRKARLVYLDPPFMTGDAFKMGGVDAYRDDLAPDAYIQMLYERLVLVRRVLAADGTVIVHLDHHASHAVKLVMDEVFGRFLNEIVWFYQGGALTSVRRHLPRKHDVLLWYANGPDHVFNPPRGAKVSDPMIRRWGHYADAEGRVPFGRIRREGQTHARLQRRFIRQHQRPPQDDEIAFVMQGSLLRSVWADIPEIRNSPRYAEATGYPTQKPLALLERIVTMTTHPGDLVIDPFCGSGTTLLAAERLGRRWIGIDRSPAAIETAARRLSRDDVARAGDGELAETIRRPVF